MGLMQAHGQILHADGTLPSFEVETIKQWKPPAPPPPPPTVVGDASAPAAPRPAKVAPGKPGAVTSDRVHSITPVRPLIASAYDVPFGYIQERILGGPAWIESEQ